MTLTTSSSIPADGADMVRFVAFAVGASLALSAFGVQVCPYLHGFGAAGVGVVFASVFGIAALLRGPLQRRLVFSVSPLDQPGRQASLDFALFVAVGVGVMVVNRVGFSFPFHSGVRLVVGSVTLGLFAALDSALRRERQVVTHLHSADIIAASPSIDVSSRFFSLSKKFAVVSLALATMITVDILLLGTSDFVTAFQDAVPVTNDMAKLAQKELMIEGMVTLAVLFPLIANLVITFAGNLRLFLAKQRDVLDAVAAGRFDVAVPVASRDEFALIAERTNQMIEGLRDRRRMQQLVSKLASPQVAQRLLTDGGAIDGSRRHVVVLFSDVRNFTTRTESAAPEVIVKDLNAYFTEMVAVVHAHGGLVDKFIGDGMMAIFGFEGEATAADDAVAAACEMHRRVEQLNQTLSAPIAIGVGIHQGEVIAGTIGSPERLEFTFIGDTVNTAARLEGLTKELGSPLVSDAVMGSLKSGRALPWRDDGPQMLKGKHEAVTCFVSAGP